MTNKLTGGHTIHPLSKIKLWIKCLIEHIIQCELLSTTSINIIIITIIRFYIEINHNKYRDSITIVMLLYTMTSSLLRISRDEGEYLLTHLSLTYLTQLMLQFLSQLLKSETVSRPLLLLCTCANTIFYVYTMA